MHLKKNCESEMVKYFIASQAAYKVLPIPGWSDHYCCASWAGYQLDCVNVVIPLPR